MTWRPHRFEPSPRRRYDCVRCPFSEGDAIHRTYGEILRDELALARKRIGRFVRCGGLAGLIAGFVGGLIAIFIFG